MFNDEESLALEKMHEFSTVDGFMEISESLSDMIKYVANEPSVGLFYIQHHTQNAVPNLINLKNNVTEKSHEMTLHTEDSEDSITVVRSMKEFGISVADEMIEDIKKSLDIMSVKQPKRGLIKTPSFGFQIGKPSSWGSSSTAWGQDGNRSGNYFSTVFKSAKQRATSFKWPQLADSREGGEARAEKLFLYTPESGAAASTSYNSVGLEADELPLSSPVADDVKEKKPQHDENISQTPSLSLSDNYDEFRADREAKLEEWLGGDGHRN